MAGRKPRGGGLRPALLSCALMVSFAAVTELRGETTIYAGKHFELRDHDTPVKYIFNGNTRMARVAGTLSVNERIQRLRLRAGWNLVSLAVTAPDFPGQLEEYPFRKLSMRLTGAISRGFVLPRFRLEMIWIGC